MINDETTKRELGYDPSDRHSFPYQHDDPPFDATSLEFDPVVLDRAPDLDVMEILSDLTAKYDDDGPSEYRQLDMALRLFYKKSNDSAFDDIPFPDLFAACLHQAEIWERG